MSKTIAIGRQNFATLREQDCFYVDKTDLIREWWENKDDVTLIARPRRFGKALNLSMLESFFSKAYKGRGDLFEGLSIWKEEKYRELQGSKPVIFLSFADIKGETFEETVQGIKHALVKLYEIHGYVMDGKNMGEKERKYFDSVASDMSRDVAVLALKNLSDYMSRYYGQKVLIFPTFKTNPYLDRAMMTGITRISKESIFSDLNSVVSESH